MADGRGLESRDLYGGARAQNAAGLERLARRIEPVVAWPDLVLPRPIVGQLRELAGRARHRDLVLDEWGMGRRSSKGRGITALFAGDSGTGKTMSAEVIAGELGLDLYVIDLSTVVDKYIGETEKNLDRVFSEADRVNGILLFDEADSIFGKRSEVKDARDRYANVEVAYLLQRMEQFDGMAILTTNLRANVDEAFVRRLDAIIDFPMPEQEDRLRIWRTNLPAGLPLAPDLDLDFLARAFKLSGGNIRNVAVGAAYRAAEAGRPISMLDLVRETEREYRKLGRLVVESEFGAHFRAPAIITNFSGRDCDRAGRRSPNDEPSWPELLPGPARHRRASPCRPPGQVPSTGRTEDAAHGHGSASLGVLARTTTRQAPSSGPTRTLPPPPAFGGNQAVSRLVAGPPRRPRRAPSRTAVERGSGGALPASARLGQSAPAAGLPAPLEPATPGAAPGRPRNRRPRRSLESLAPPRPPPRRLRLRLWAMASAGHCRQSCVHESRPDRRARPEPVPPRRPGSGQRSARRNRRTPSARSWPHRRAHISGPAAAGPLKAPPLGPEQDPKFRAVKARAQAQPAGPRLTLRPAPRSPRLTARPLRPRTMRPARARPPRSRT